MILTKIILRNLSVKVPGKQTNNNAEIYSVIKAIDIVKATGNSFYSLCK